MCVIEPTCVEIRRAKFFGESKTRNSQLPSHPTRSSPNGQRCFDSHNCYRFGWCAVSGGTHTLLELRPLARILGKLYHKYHAHLFPPCRFPRFALRTSLPVFQWAPSRTRALYSAPKRLSTLVSRLALPWVWPSWLGFWVRRGPLRFWYSRRAPLLTKTAPSGSACPTSWPPTGLRRVRPGLLLPSGLCS